MGHLNSIAPHLASLSGKVPLIDKFSKQPRAMLLNLHSYHCAMDTRGGKVM